MKKKLLCVTLSIVLIMCFSSPMVLAESSDKDSVNIVNFRNTIQTIETELENDNSSVLLELRSFLSILQQEQLCASDLETSIKVGALINQTQENILLYEQYQQETNAGSDSIVNRGVYDPTYSAAVLAIIAYFNNHNYLLAAELLTHAMNNNVLNSSYYPLYGSRVLHSNVYSTIISSGNTSGTGIFPQSSSDAILMDLYYGIHEFEYEIVGSYYGGCLFCLNDRYDYTKGGMYTGIANAAVQTMYGAQQLGVIVPFYTRIDLEF